jgi:hypothetical protein
MSFVLEEIYTSESDTAQQLGQAERTLRKWRREGLGPPWVKIGRRIFYPTAGILPWLKGAWHLFLR